MTIDELQVVITAETSQIKSQLTSLTNELSRITQKANKSFDGLPKNATKAAITVKKDVLKQFDLLIAETEAKLNKLSELLLKSMEKGYIGKYTTDDYSKQIDTYDNYIQTLKEYKKKYQSGQTEVDIGNLDKLPETIDETNAKIDEMQAKLQDSGMFDTVSNNIKHSVEGAIAALNSLNEPLAKLSSRTADVFKNLYLGSISQIVEYFNDLQNLGYSKEDIIKTIKINISDKDRIFLEQINKDINSRINIKVDNKPTEEPKAESNNNIGKYFGTFTKALFMTRSLYTFVRRIITQNENLTAAVTNFFSSISTILSPVLNFLAKLINSISNIITKFAKLLGISTKNAKSNSTSERYLASFDELDRVTSNDDTNSYTSWKWLDDRLKAIVDYFNSIKYVPGSQDDGGWSSSEGGILDFAPKLSEWLSKPIKWIYDLTKDGGTISKFFSNIWDSIKTDFSNNWETFKETTIQPIIKAFNKAKEVASSVWTSFTDGAKNAVSSCTTTISSLWTNIKDGIKSAMNSVISKIETGLNRIVKSINNAGLIKGLNKWFNADIALSTISIPRLAKGGVLTTPTVVQVGEYAGATSNPEIVTPQSIMYDTITSANTELASAFIQVGRQIIASIENKDLSVNIGDDEIAMSAARGNYNYKLRTGAGII